MQRKFNFAIDEFYHLYNRGNNKGVIFYNDTDRRRFQHLLHLCNSVEPVVFKTIQGSPLDEIEIKERLVDIGVYCLMDNHFHILVRERVEGGIVRFMAKLSTAYTMYFNKKNMRTGSLLSGRFRAKHVDSDPYLKYLFAYIHLNPVKLIDPEWKEDGIFDRKKAELYLNNYDYSSYFEYTGKERREKVILNREAFPEYFSGTQDFKDFIKDWISLKEDF